MKRVYIEGVAVSCPSALYLTGCADDFFGRNGYVRVEKADQADVVLINGCNTNQRNPEIFRSYVEYAIAHPDKTVLAYGCVPELPKGRRPANFRLVPYSKVSRNPSAMHEAIGAKYAFEFQPADTALRPMLGHIKGIWKEMSGIDVDTSCLLHISGGCLSKCAFCAIRPGKGDVHSTPPEKLLGEADAAWRAGRRDYWLISDDAGAWGADLGLDAADLFAGLLRAHPEARLMADQFHPAHFLRLYDRVSPHLHAFDLLGLPIESGSDRVLRLMDRGYRAGDIRSLVERLRAAHPSLRLYTQAIVGFPGETREEHASTLELASLFDIASFLPMRVFSNTPAAALEGAVAPKELGARMSRTLDSGAGSPRHRAFDLGRYTSDGPDKIPAAVLWVQRGSWA